MGVLAEGVLDLVSDGVEAEEGVADQENNERSRLVRRGHEPEGQREAIHSHDPVNQDRVAEGNRGALDPLAATLNVRQRREAGL